jgi:NADH-quinone oxidoreductase subunit L
VGLCSYLLIGFWSDRPEAARAAKKAFITTRIGDVLLMLGVFVMWVHFGSFDFDVVLGHEGALPEIAAGTATAISLLLLGGAVGKSAQLPLHVWLPDAMAGPTPVSALIHAATMVTAGVYLVVRSHVLFEISEVALTVVAVVGLASALYAGFSSLGQYDMKRALAYSTMSQLGFMFLAAGLGYDAVAISLLVAHAFYKALLFLTSGNVMHGLHDEIDVRRLGGLRRDMPWTAALFAAGALALSGLPPFSGFFTKDAILELASHDGEVWAYVLGSLGALVSAWYIARLYFTAFMGDPRYEGHAHEASPLMRAPLVVLAIGALFAGAWLAFTPEGRLATFLEPVVGHVVEGDAGPSTQVLIAISIVLTLAGIAIAWSLYRPRNAERWISFPEREPGMAGALGHGFYIDDLYAWVVGTVGLRGAEGVAWFDRTVVDGAVIGVGRAVMWAAGLAPIWQSGKVRRYALTFLAGGAALLLYAAVRV